MDTGYINIKRELVKSARKLAAERLVIATDGNISAKQGNNIYIKRSKISFKSAKSSDFISIKHIHDISIEWRLHDACYSSRPDIKAVVHTHSQAILILASVGMHIKPVTTDFVIYFKNGIKQVPFASPGSKMLAQKAAKAIKTHNGVILANHGLVTVGTTLKEAVTRSILAEREAKITLASRLLKRPIKGLKPSQIKSIYEL